MKTKRNEKQKQKQKQNPMRKFSPLKPILKGNEVKCEEDPFSDAKIKTKRQNKTLKLEFKTK